MDFREWTDIPIKDGLAAGAVSYYLETDHPIHGLFDADLFMRDLACGQKNFCSPMLVNAVLGWSCVGPRCSRRKAYILVQGFLTGIDAAIVPRHRASRDRVQSRFLRRS